MPQKRTLEAEFVKDMQDSLEGNELKRMVPCKVDYNLVDSKGPRQFDIPDVEIRQCTDVGYPPIAVSWKCRSIVHTQCNRNE